MQKFGVWVGKPATMIKKVAEAQGLRASFQELFAGTYEESENWKDTPAPDASIGTDDPNLNAGMPSKMPQDTTTDKNHIMDAQIVEKPATPQQTPPVGTVEDHGTYTMEQRDGYRTMQSKPVDPIADLERQIEMEETSYNIGCEHPTETEQFYRAQAKSRAKIDVMKQKLSELKSKDLKTAVVHEDDIFPPKAEAVVAHNKAAADIGKVPEDQIPPGKIRPDQNKKMYAVWGEYCRAAGVVSDAMSKDFRKKLIFEMFAVDSSTKLNEHQADELIARIEADTREASM